MRYKVYIFIFEMPQSMLSLQVNYFIHQQQENEMD